MGRASGTRGRPIETRRAEPRERCGAPAVAAVALVTAACGGRQSVLAPAGYGAEVAAAQWWVLLAAGAAIYGVVIGALVLAVARRRRPGSSGPHPDATRWIVVGGAVVPAIVVGTLLLVSLRAVERVTADTDAALRVQVVGHQWWWEIRYPEHGVVTANELHLPVGQGVDVELSSPDVIHSFWVPALEGKRDLIPGRTNRLRLAASRPGVYRGQCAEYCGWQHARMGLLVVADRPEAFQAWLAAQHAPATDPLEPLRQEGRELFLGLCASCHTIRGTPAAGQFGPDLTHLGSRRTLAAGLLSNTPDNLAAWIGDAQALKPGNKMPRQHLDPGALAALAAYLGGLR